MANLYQKIIDFNHNRLPKMVKLKYKLMTENAFRFFRGTCHLFYERLAAYKNLPKSPLVWMCGDLHLENFGSFKGDNKLVYFDLNDFDESILAPALWEVLRLITSILIAFETLEIGQDQGVNMAILFLNSYAQTLCKGKAVSIEPRTAKGIVRKFLKHADKRSFVDLLEKRTQIKGKKVKLSLQHERHFKIEKALKKELITHINEWIAMSSDSPYNYKVKDAVFRLAGTGSLGVKRYLFLLKSTNTKDNYLFVDMKQSFPSSLTPFVKIAQPNWENESDRIISVQQRLQNVSSSLLSRTEFKGDCYVLQELQPVEDTFDFNMVKDNYRNLIKVIDDMAVLTASAQLRSGGMDGSAIIDELKAFGSDLSNWKDEALDFAVLIAADFKADYEAFLKDYKERKFVQKVEESISFEA
jgi:uncharacterized protein (DUF2252 family)